MVLALVGWVIPFVGIILEIIAISLGLNARKTYSEHPLYAPEFGSGRATVALVLSGIFLGLALLIALLIMLLVIGAAASA